MLPFYKPSKTLPKPRGRPALHQQPPPPTYAQVRSPSPHGMPVSSPRVSAAGAPRCGRAPAPTPAALLSPAVPCRTPLPAGVGAFEPPSGSLFMHHTVRSAAPSPHRQQSPLAADGRGCSNPPVLGRVSSAAPLFASTRCSSQPPRRSESVVSGAQVAVLPPKEVAASRPVSPSGTAGIHSPSVNLCFFQNTPTSAQVRYVGPTSPTRARSVGFWESLQQQAVQAVQPGACSSSLLRQASEGNVSHGNNNNNAGSLAAGNSVPPAAPQQPQKTSGNTENKCGAGLTVTIGDHKFRCVSILGRGSYSEVWRAEVIQGAFGMTEVALKEVRCKNQSELQQAIFEVQVLLVLERAAAERLQPWRGGATAATADTNGTSAIATIPLPHLRVPRCISYKVDPCGNSWVVRTAMSVVPGEAMDAFIRRPPPSSEPLLTCSRRGCALAEKMIRDIGPMLELLAPIAWHRDVNAHNIIIHGVEPDTDVDQITRKASFWLIDFGLAVDSQSWVTANGNWRTEYIGGDCRYWPPSSWIMHLLGPDGFETNSKLCEQYQWRLDIHGLGVTALELLCAVALQGTTSPDTERQEEQRNWENLFTAWRRYRDDVWEWWYPVYTVFSTGGDIAPVQAKLLQDGVVDKLIQHLSDIRQALHTCASSLSEDRAGDACLLRLISDMIDETSNVELSEIDGILGHDPMTPKVINGTGGMWSEGSKKSMMNQLLQAQVQQQQQLSPRSLPETRRSAPTLDPIVIGAASRGSSPPPAVPQQPSPKGSDQPQMCSAATQPQAALAPALPFRQTPPVSNAVFLDHRVVASPQHSPRYLFSTRSEQHLARGHAASPAARSLSPQHRSRATSPQLVLHRQVLPGGAEVYTPAVPPLPGVPGGGPAMAPTHGVAECYSPRYPGQPAVFQHMLSPRHSTASMVRASSTTSAVHGGSGFFMEPGSAEPRPAHNTVVGPVGSPTAFGSQPPLAGCSSPVRGYRNGGTTVKRSMSGYLYTTPSPRASLPTSQPASMMLNGRVGSLEAAGEDHDRRLQDRIRKLEEGLQQLGQDRIQRAKLGVQRLSEHYLPADRTYHMAATPGIAPAPVMASG